MVPWGVARDASRDAVRGMARALSLLAAAVAIGGLACGAIQPDGARAARDPGAVTVDGLRLVLWDGPGVIFSRTPRPDLRRYRGILFAETSIEYRGGTPARRSLDETRLREHLRSAVAEELTQTGDWAVVEGPGEAVLQVGLAVLDLALRDLPLANRQTTSYVAPSGNVSIVLDLRDSLSGEPLLRYAQRRVLPGGVFYDPTTVELERTQKAFDVFAEDTRAGIEWFRGEFERLHRDGGEESG